MKPVVPAVLICLASVGPAAAQARNVTSRMTCADATAIVRREGSIMLGIGGASERLVRDRSFCDAAEIAELRFVPTRDNPQCPVGYRCKEPDYGDWNWE